MTIQVQVPSLPEILVEFARGNVSVVFAGTHLLKYQQSLLLMEQHFLAGLAALPAESAEWSQGPARSVKRLLHSLRLLADSASSLVDAGSLAGLPSLADEIQAATHDLNAEIATFREVSLSAQGPTGLAGINLIAKTVQAVLDGHPAARERLDNHIDLELCRIESAQFAGAPSPEFAAQLTGLENALKGLSSASSLQVGLDRLLSQAEQFEASLAGLQDLDALSQGPSSSARINRLLDLAERVWDEQAELAELIGLSTQLQGNLDLWRSQLNSLLGGLGPSPGVVEPARATEEAYQNLDALLVSFCKSVEEQDGDTYESLREGLVQAWHQIEVTQNLLEVAFEEVDKVTCPVCGHLNRKHARTCQQCSAATPRTHDVDFRTPPADRPMTVNLSRIFTAVDRFTEGQLGHGEFQAEVAWMMGLVAQETPLATTASGRAGLQEMAAGLDLLAQMTQAGETSVAAMGARLIWEGSAKLQAA